MLTRLIRLAKIFNTIFHASERQNDKDLLSMNRPLLTVKSLAVIYSKALCGLTVFVLHNEQNAGGFHLHTALHSRHFTDTADYLS